MGNENDRRKPTSLLQGMGDLARSIPQPGISPEVQLSIAEQAARNQQRRTTPASPQPERGRAGDLFDRYPKGFFSIAKEVWSVLGAKK